jgi:hypothetical protein
MRNYISLNPRTKEARLVTPKPLRQIAPLPFGTHPGRPPQPKTTIVPQGASVDVKKKKNKRKIITPIDLSPTISNNQADLLLRATKIKQEQVNQNRKTIRLPEFLCESKVFPDTSQTTAQRWQQVRFLTKHLADIRKEDFQKKVSAVMSCKMNRRIKV